MFLRLVREFASLALSGDRTIITHQIATVVTKALGQRWLFPSLGFFFEFSIAMTKQLLLEGTCSCLHLSLAPL